MVIVVVKKNCWLPSTLTHTHAAYSSSELFFFLLGQQWTICLDMVSQVIRHGLHVLDEAWFMCMHAPEELSYLFLICKLYVHSLESMTSPWPSTLPLALLLQGAGMPFELELIRKEINLVFVCTFIYIYIYIYILNGQLHMHLVGFEPTTSSSTYFYGRKKCHMS